MNNEYEETFNGLQYIKENFYGLILLAIVLFIIYFVDYITQLNVLMYSIQVPISKSISVTSNPYHKFSKKKD
jgi:hypothetical protein